MKTELLPEVLHQYQPRLETALATPVLITWDENEAFHTAEQPAAIGKALVQALRPELANTKIAYIYREHIKRRDKTVLAQASKVGGKLGFFSGYDLMIEVNWDAWRFLQPEKKLALIDHELCHFDRTITKKGETKYVLVSHDVEEFSSIVRRWGLWKADLKSFAKTIKESGQLALFDQPEPEAVKADEAPKDDAPKSSRKPRAAAKTTATGVPVGLH